ncbi:MAG TPA: ATP-binding protein [Solirubrobacteraceae bacterium]|nr:ATP-binding protein [Solirubrobacteraceae bacterium]
MLPPTRIPARTPGAPNLVALPPGCRRRGGRRASDRQPGEEERASQALAAAESRRFAAQVHDLIMQDLSYALASARALEDDPALASRVATVIASAERALAGAREVLGDLSTRERKPLAAVLEQTVRTAARDTPITLALAPGIGAEPDGVTLDALVHIAREAVTNAVKHGQAEDIVVTLDHGDEWTLRVADRGHGFDPADRRGGGFGLDSMLRHAQELGGRLGVTSAPGAGTTVEAVLP